MKAFIDLIKEYLDHPETIAFLKEKKDFIVKKLDDIEKYISENPKGTIDFMNCIYQVLISHVKAGKINSESIKKIDEFAENLGTEEAKLFARNMRGLIEQYSQK